MRRATTCIPVLCGRRDGPAAHRDLPLALLLGFLRCEPKPFLQISTSPVATGMGVGHRTRGGLTSVRAEGLAVGAGGDVAGHVIRTEQVAGVVRAHLQLAGQLGMILRKGRNV